jgi:hypothetical protein
MGLAMPPMLLANAIPKIKVLAKGLSGGRFRNTGWIIEKHKTGAATLEIHMLAIIATNMFMRRTLRALVPALERMYVAMECAIWYFDSAAAMAKPPRRSMMTGVHIAEKMYFVAAGAGRRTCCLSSVRTTRKRTHSIGTKRDVTKRGMTYVRKGA